MKKIYPPAHFYTYFFISVSFHFLLPVKQIIFIPYNFLGFIPAIIGVVLNIQTDNLFKKLNTTVKPDQKPSVLIDYGSFKISRNPMYLGMSLMLIGAGILMGSVTAFLGAVFFVFSMEKYFIPDEEKLMREAFGEKFDDYKKIVRRWI